MKRVLGSLLLPMFACTRPGVSAKGEYTPRRRDVTVTTVPLLVKEQEKVFPFLGPAFAKGGVLEGKEVYAFSPATITVDTTYVAKRAGIYPIVCAVQKHLPMMSGQLVVLSPASVSGGTGAAR